MAGCVAGCLPAPASCHLPNRFLALIMAGGLTGEMLELAILYAYTWSAIHHQFSALLQAFIHSKMRKRMNMMMMELAQAKATFDA